jgi:glycine/D-amino acid oxidase-like deaminating enzyme
MPKRIIVIGAGIIGTTVAYHLAKSGGDVVVLDAQDAIGGVATPNSWAWINASWGNDRDYARLRMQSIEAWRRLDKDVPGLAINWCGSLLWDLPPDKLRAFAEEHKSWGYPTRLVNEAEARAIEPRLRHYPQEAVHVAIEGSVEPSHAVTQIANAARLAGVDFVPNARVKWLVESNGAVTGLATTETEFEADEVVVAAGVDSAAVLQTTGIELALNAPAGLLVHSEAAPELLKGLVLSPDLHVRQSPDGRLIAGSDFTGTPTDGNPETAAADLFAKVKELVKCDQSLAMSHYTTGYRPTPADGLPAIGRPKNLKGLYVAVMHSGVTLAPIVGQIAAVELLHDKRAHELARYHPDRLIT